MNKKRTQSEKLFSHEELTKLTKKMDSLELMEKIDRNYGLSKIFNNSHFNGTKKAINKLLGSKSERK